MVRVLILGASGRTGSLVVKSLLSSESVQPAAYVRSPARLDDSLKNHIRVIEGDVLDTSALTCAMKNTNIVVAALSGDLLSQAKSISSALSDSAVSHIFWVTGLGIHHEVPGEVGKALEHFVSSFPEYVEAADTIASSGIPCTLVRAASLTDGSNTDYYVQLEGEPIHGKTVDRCAVAKFIADQIISEKALDRCNSFGITN